jgi:hypothetical protein
MWISVKANAHPVIGTQQIGAFYADFLLRSGGLPRSGAIPTNPGGQAHPHP